MVTKLVAKSDIIIPLAALVGAPLCAQDPSNAVSINRDSVLKLVKLVGRNQKLVFPTSNSGYGVGEEDNYCTEESPLRPVSLYGKTKVEAEQAILDSGNGITLRLATVFGMAPRMRTDLLVNDFVYRAISDRVVVLFEGHFKRNYIHIRDVARAFLHTISHYSSMNNEPYNVGLSTANLSKLELCQRIQAVLPNFSFLEAPFGQDPDKRDYIISNEKVERTGWRAEWPLERGILELVKGLTMLRDRRFGNV